MTHYSCASKLQKCIMFIINLCYYRVHTPDTLSALKAVIQVVADLCYTFVAYLPLNGAYYSIKGKY